MFNAVKNRLEKELKRFLLDIDKIYCVSKISPLLFKSIENFVLREGKRIRPLLFCVGYLGFAKKVAKNLYRSALSLELLHDFMLVHDDIIDKSDTRRGKPSMHKILDLYLKKDYKNIKFNGQDLAIVVGDVIYAIAFHAFLSIKEDPMRKDQALRKFVEAAFYTGAGEFIELLYGKEDLEKIKKDYIYKIYDLKTAYYSFAYPLAIGAILAGANKAESDKLFQYGIYLGRAFQIKDDILGLFSEESKIGKSNLSDLQEAKKTILILYAYNNSNNSNKALIRRIFTKKKIDKNDLLKIREIITKTGALDKAKREISRLHSKTENIISSSMISPRYKKILNNYSKEILNAN
jgi:geranylgeranyl diphosphate synthase type I